ncbi:MAG: SPOR domain-containing protein [Methylophilaceae bacterium]|nr:SPOR domain-containing protein [Methylophilaceae bacterium]
MASPPILDDPDQSARRAKVRIGIALTLLIAAIGGLALLNQQKSEPLPEEAVSQQQDNVANENTAIPNQISSAQQEPPPPLPVTEPTTLPSQPSGPAQPAASPSPPSTPAEPPLPPPPPPQVNAAAPEPASSPAKTPATKPSVTLAEPRVPVKPEDKSLSTPVAQKPTSVQPSAPPPKTEATPKSFAVQVGVFTDMENAKQLQTKLAEHGIPSYTETKLQVGPFTTRAEAEAARDRLKALGISAVVVPGK